MGTRLVLLSGIAAFGLGLWAVGGLFDEPGKRDAYSPSQLRPTPAALKWELWQPPARSVPAAATEPEPDLVTAPDPDRVPDPASGADDSAPDTIWATPDAWSSEE